MIIVPPRRPLAPSALALVATLTSLLVGVPAAAQRIANPDLYEKSAEAARQALEHYQAPHDPEALRRVADIGYQLAMQSGYEDVPFTFFLIDMPVPNAFALPGGHIFVTTGMLGLGLTDDMLANLLGHEVAHVTKRHGIRMQRKATLLNILGQTLLLGVLVGVDNDNQPARDGTYQAGDSRKGSLVQGAMATSVVVNELLLRNYGRDFEDEADDEGQRLAAAGGWDPDGARQLWELMNARMPQTKTYGYWRTHPFSDVRMRAAESRAAELKVQEPKPDEDYRAKTQRILLGFAERTTGKKKKDKEAKKRFTESAALTAWPVSLEAEKLRIAALHRQRDQELERPNEVSRDYGKVVRAYLAALDEVRAITPKSGLIPTLEREVADLRAASTELYPRAQTVWQGGIYETPFLETFLSNFPTVKEVPDVALTLGNAYSRLGRQTDAVRQFLRAAAADPDGEAAGKAQRGLHTLAPRLEELTALQEISNQAAEDDLRSVADQRLVELSDTYEDIALGAEYVRRFPQGAHATTVQERLGTLAQNLYGEVLLYRAVGDSVKALERIQLILTHAPLSEAAEQLRDEAVVDS